jgi:hypothetical protein
VSPTLLTETAAAPQPFSLAAVITVLVVAVVVYPLQKRFRHQVSQRRRERWAEEDRIAQERLRARDAEPTDRPAEGPADDGSV